MITTVVIISQKVLSWSLLVLHSQILSPGCAVVPNVWCVETVQDANLPLIVRILGPWTGTRRYIQNQIDFCLSVTSTSLGDLSPTLMIYLHLDSDEGMLQFTTLHPRQIVIMIPRVCAGRYMADNTVWLTVASVLATLTLGKAKDKNGNEINILGEYTSGMLRYV